MSHTATHSFRGDAAPSALFRREDGHSPQRGMGNRANAKAGKAIACGEKARKGLGAPFLASCPPCEAPESRYEANHGPRAWLVPTRTAPALRANELGQRHPRRFAAPLLWTSVLLLLAPIPLLEWSDRHCLAAIQCRPPPLRGTHALDRWAGRRPVWAARFRGARRWRMDLCPTGGSGALRDRAPGLRNGKLM